MFFEHYKQQLLCREEMQRKLQVVCRAMGEKGHCPQGSCFLMHGRASSCSGEKHLVLHRQILLPSWSSSNWLLDHAALKEHTAQWLLRVVNSPLAASNAQWLRASFRTTFTHFEGAEGLHCHSMSPQCPFPETRWLGERTTRRGANCTLRTSCMF